MSAPPASAIPKSAAPLPAPLALVPLLTVMAALGPFTLNVVLPAIPRMADRFQVEVGHVQLLLSAFLIGMAVSQLLLGTLSDRFGRKPVILGGLVLTLAGSLAATFADSVDSLIAARVVQSLGASSGLVIGRAIVRDLFAQKDAAGILSVITMGMVVAPMLAPTVGGLIDDHFGWRVIFAVIAVLSVAMTVLVAALLPETRPPEAHKGQSGGEILRDAAHLLREKRFLSYAGTVVFATAGFFAFVGGAPHIIVSLMERPASEYGLWFVLTSFVYMGGNACTKRYVGRVGPDKLILIGAWLSVVSGVMLLAVALLGWVTSPVWFFLPLLPMTFANGLQLPSAVAGTVSVNPQVAGSASGLTGFSQMLFGALVAQASGVGVSLFHSATPVCALILVSSLAALVCAQINTR